jgi:hypothetical protein
MKFFYFNPVCHIDNIMEKPAIKILLGLATKCMPRLSLALGYSADGFSVKTW